MHGPTCIFWANLTASSLKGKEAKDKHDAAAAKIEHKKRSLFSPMLAMGAASPGALRSFRHRPVYLISMELN
jgi:hypothetical protein